MMIKGAVAKCCNSPPFAEAGSKILGTSQGWENMIYYIISTLEGPVWETRFLVYAERQRASSMVAKVNITKAACFGPLFCIFVGGGKF